MNNQPNSTQQPRVFWREGILVFFLSALLFSIYQFASPHLLNPDGYYHIQFASEMRQHGFLSNFPWAAFSLWVESFSDKDFLYHLYLIPFTFFPHLEDGIKVATLLLTAGVFTLFYSMLRTRNVSAPALWLVLLAGSGGDFLFRVMETRPQVMAVLIWLLMVWFLVDRKLRALAVLCFFYPWAHSSFILAVVFGGIILVDSFLFERKLDWKPFAVCFGATLVGMVIHPYFPKNWEFFYIQSIYTLLQGIQHRELLGMGGEFAPYSTQELLKQALIPLTLLGLTFYRMLGSEKRTSRQDRELFLFALAVLFLTFFSRRFIELSIPGVLLFCAGYLGTQFQPGGSDKSPSLKSILVGVTLALFFLAGVARTYHGLHDQFTRPTAAYKGAAEYLAQHASDNEVIFTCDWDHAPELWFFNPKNRYMVFLDPNFMYYWDPETWEIWMHTSNGHLREQSSQVLREKFSVRYGVCQHKFAQLRQHLEADPAAEIVYRDRYVYVFSLR